ncbi:Lin0512 family protein [Enterococcus timonensis]|uniref:Lin0512 family protein n=1 Tax=Enterococcus timonensis TaxID=1852364 RepID=UPI0008DA5DC7|nr:Lin0512 family protein [Enterococcus timonensis]
MKKLLFIQTGMGVDVHGQDVTKASERAVRNAIYHNSMPGIVDLLPDGNLNAMEVVVKLALPADFSELDQAAVKKLIPYGTVTLDLQVGGMKTTSGIYLSEKNDHNELMYIVIASVEVYYEEEK